RTGGTARPRGGREGLPEATGKRLVAAWHAAVFSVPSYVAAATSAAERAGMLQSIGSRPAAISASLARENGRLPKNPLRADSGDGWADSMTTWRDVSMSAFFLRADAPQR